MRILASTRRKINKDGSRSLNGIIYHRIAEPLRFMPDWVETDTFDNPGEVKHWNYDYLLFNRSLGFGIEGMTETEAQTDFIEQAKENGLKVIVDLDDYWELPEHHTIRWRDDLDYEEWRNNILVNLSHADYVWTSTEILK